MTSNYSKQKLLYHIVEKDGRMRGGVISDIDTFSNNDIESKNNQKVEQMTEKIVSESIKHLYQSEAAFTNIKGNEQEFHSFTKNKLQTAQHKNEAYQNRPYSSIKIGEALAQTQSHQVQFIRSKLRNQSSHYQQMTIADTTDIYSKTNESMTGSIKRSGGGTIQVVNKETNSQSRNAINLIDNNINKRQYLTSAYGRNSNYRNRQISDSVNLKTNFIDCDDLMVGNRFRAERKHIKSRNNGLSQDQLVSQTQQEQTKSQQNSTVTNKEFLKMIQNKSIYRRDNLVRQLSNQMKRTINQVAGSSDMIALSSSIRSSYNYNNFDQQSLGFRNRNDKVNQSPSMHEARARPYSSLTITGYGKPNKQKCMIQVNKINKTFSKNQHLITQNKYKSFSKMIHQTLEATKGIPEDLMPKGSTHEFPTSLHFSKDYKSSLNEDLLRKSLVQIVCTDYQRQEFELVHSDKLIENKQRRLKSAQIYGARKRLAHPIENRSPRIELLSNNNDWQTDVNSQQEKTDPPLQNNQYHKQYSTQFDQKQSIYLQKCVDPYFYKTINTGGNEQQIGQDVNMNYFKKNNKLNLQQRRKVILRKKQSELKVSVEQGTVKDDKAYAQSLIAKEKKLQEKKRKHFDETLEQKRNNIKSKDYLYHNIQTTIIKNDNANLTPKYRAKTQNTLIFTTKQKRSSSLDDAFKELKEAQQAYTNNLQDPIEEEYKQLIENLREYKLKFGFDEFIKGNNNGVKQQFKSKAQLQQIENAKTQSITMLRSRSFIQSEINKKKSKEDKLHVLREIEHMIEEIDENKKENNRDYFKKKLEKEVNQLILDLSTVSNKDSNTNKKTANPRLVLNTLDASFIKRLEAIKDLSALDEDDKLLKILGITSEDMEKRKRIENDRLFKVLCPDGVTREQKDNFEDDTNQFLTFLYEDFMIKSQAVPGTEIPDLFQDSIHMQGIKKYLDLISQTISQNVEIFNETNQNENIKIQWASPLSYNKPSNSRYQALLNKGSQIDLESTAKSTLAHYFLQKINTMGFLNKVIQDNLQKIRAKKSNQETYAGQIGCDLKSQQLKYIEQQLKKKKLLRLLDYQLIDNVLSELKFFSLFDKEIRINIYKMSNYEIYPTKGTIIDNNIEKTDYMYVILKGTVSLTRRDYELGIDIPLSTLKAGESFGDVSIQSNLVNPYDIINKNIVFAQQEESETHLLKFERKQFTLKLFKEMKEELYSKIMLLKNAEFFSDLSPYALVILASNVQVKAFNYGDIIVYQNQIPKECFIILEGECKSVYDLDVVKSTEISKYAKKCLQYNIPEPFRYNQTDYKQQARIARENTTPLKDKQLPTVISPEQKAKTNNNINKHNRGEQKQEKLAVVDEDIERKTNNKFSFQNELLKVDSQNNEVKFKHHVPFDKLKTGNCIGYRALLDKQIIRRNVIDESEKYSAQLGITLDIIKLEQSSQENEFAQSKLQNQDLNEADDANVDDQAYQYYEDNLQNDNGFADYDEQARAAEEKREQLTRKQVFYRSKLYDKITQQLLLSQVSIIADTAVVKVMVIQKEDKNFLNETLKNIIDRKILDIGFKDHDRPMPKIEDILSEVEKDRNWSKFKSNLENNILREMAMTKKMNKLLD